MTGYWESLVVSKGGYRNITPGADPNVDNLSEVNDYNKYRHLDGAIGGASAQRVGVNRKIWIFRTSVGKRNRGFL